MEKPLLSQTSPRGLSENDRKRLKAWFNNICVSWNSLKPPRVHHWRVWKRWVVKMDHHCPWMNNWIGAQNMKLFLVLLFYVAVGTAVALVIFALTIIRWVREDCIVFDRSGILILFGAATLFWIVFWAFTIVMLVSMFGMISKDTSTIDMMQRKKFKKKKTSSELIKETFGGDFSISWFLPTRIKVNKEIENCFNQAF